MVFCYFRISTIVKSKKMPQPTPQQIEALLDENRRRNQAILQPFEPESGRGAPYPAPRSTSTDTLHATFLYPTA